MDERDAFLAAISENPTDHFQRCVFADWLDERGEHSEADRQRKYVAAEAYLKDFAARSKRLEWAERDGRLEEVQEELTFDQLMEVVAHHLGHEGDAEDRWAGCYFPVHDSDGGYGELLDAPARAAFWEAVEVVTGEPVPEVNRHRNPFACCV